MRLLHQINIFKKFYIFLTSIIIIGVSCGGGTTQEIPKEFYEDSISSTSSVDVTIADSIKNNLPKDTISSKNFENEYNGILKGSEEKILRLKLNINEEISIESNEEMVLMLTNKNGKAINYDNKTGVPSNYWKGKINQTGIYRLSIRSKTGPQNPEKLFTYFLRINKLNK